ncbi:DUF2238 domain-containing protein [Lysobacter humi (ex Lee et al. 2017)]
MASRPAPRLAFGAVVGLFVLTWIHPRWPVDQALHSSLTVVALVALGLELKRHTLRDRDYVLLCVFLALHCIGSRWLYTNVPYDAWARTLTGTSISDLFGWTRNHYDRLVHLAYGICLTPALAATLRRRRGLDATDAFIVAVLLVMASSLAYEWAEWSVALVLSPEAAEAYNGQQGDPWDAHADMLLATLGALGWAPLRPQRAVQPA